MDVNFGRELAVYDALAHVVADKCAAVWSGLDGLDALSQVGNLGVEAADLAEKVFLASVERRKVFVEATDDLAEAGLAREVQCGGGGGHGCISLISVRWPDRLGAGCGCSPPR